MSILNGYIVSPLLTAEGLEEYVGPSYWGSDAGIIGAAFLAVLALKEGSDQI